jgi:hypothetical protein
MAGYQGWMPDSKPARRRSRVRCSRAAKASSQTSQVSTLDSSPSATFRCSLRASTLALDLRGLAVVVLAVVVLAERRGTMAVARVVATW